MRYVSPTKRSLPQVGKGYIIWYLNGSVKLKLRISTYSYYQNYLIQTQKLYSKAARFYKQHAKVNRKGSWQNIKADHKVNSIGKVEMQIRLKRFTPIGVTVNNKFQGILGRIYEVCFPSNDSMYMKNLTRPTKLSHIFMYKFHYINSQNLGIHNFSTCETWRLRFLEGCPLSTGKLVLTFKRIVGISG